MKFQLVPFENTPENAKEIQRTFGQKIDIVVGVSDEKYPAERGCAFTPLSFEPIRIAVPVRHRLADKDFIAIDDLNGEDLMLIHRNWNLHIDSLRDDIDANYPNIHIVNFDFYGLDAYNQCEINNCLIVTIDRWKDVHPLMKVIPVEWKHTIPFGILHSQEPSENVLKFLDAIEQVIKPQHSAITTG
mgnify:CR=1 FL=1